MTAMLSLVMYNVRDDVFHWAAPNWDFLRLKNYLLIDTIETR